MCVCWGGGGGGGGGGGDEHSYAVSQTSVLHMKRLKPIIRFYFFCVCVLCFQRQSFLLLFYSTVAGVLPCGGRKMSPRTSS